MSEPATLTLEIQRWHPEDARGPWLQVYEVPYRAEGTLLEALQYVKDQLDGSLTFRWSCRMAVCGSCGWMVNGRPELGCHLLLRDLLPGPVRIEALAHFPVIRDLVIDQASFIEKLESVKPWLLLAEAAGEASQPFRQTPLELAAYYQQSLCINCLLCYSACPQVGLNPEFLGPAALALLDRYDADSRDAGAEERRPARDADSGVWGCTLVGHCSEVCPQGVDPARAINRNKLPSARDTLLDLLMPGRRR